MQFSAAEDKEDCMEVIRTKQIMDRDEINRTLMRMAHEILEHHQNYEDMILIGTRTGGVYLSRIIREKIKKIENIEIPIGTLDITLYRDDLSRIGYQRLVHKTEVPINIDDRVIVLIDDVLFTGRTVRAAMDALTDLGRPSMIQLAVLVDRGHRELPIRADYAGRIISTSRKENVEVIFDDDHLPLKVILQELPEQD